jgi:aldose 1-epimerase
VSAVETTGFGDATAVTLRSDALAVRVLDHGGIIQSVQAPDRHGVSGEVTLGYPDIAGYRASRVYPGAIIGRCAGRIAGGQITVDGIDYRLSRNEGDNTLHGGAVGFDAVRWGIVAAGVEDGASVLRLRHISPAGDQGFPGRATVDAIYSVVDDTLTLELTATTDAATPVNLTSHPYWNLSGTRASIADHVLTLAADRLFVSGERQIVGGAVPVAGPFDLRRGRVLRDLLADADPQITAFGGIDHVFSADGAPVARLVHPASGRTLEVRSDAPAVVVYTGQGLRAEFGAHAGIAIEPQALPGQAGVVRPGDVWRWQTSCRFGNDG